MIKYLNKIFCVMVALRTVVILSTLFATEAAYGKVVVSVLDDEQDMIIYGSVTFDGLGYPLHAEDVNNDGKKDFIVSATGNDGPDQSKINAGVVYVFFGDDAWPVAGDAATLADVTIYGAEHGINGVEGDEVAYAISSADFNQDGRQDLLLSAIWGDGPDNSRPDCGDLYILYGRDDWPSVMDLSTDADVIIYGIDGGDGTGDPEDPDKGDLAGLSLATGDLNGDGLPDIVIGAPLADGPGEERIHGGEAYILWGRNPMPSVIDLASDSNMTTIYGGEQGDFLGLALFVEDLNKDGFDDLMIHAIQADGPENSRTNCGETYIVYGGNSLPSTIDLATQADVTIFGAEAGDQDFNPVHYMSAADFNGDGWPDLAIGAPFADGRNNETFESGETYLIFGDGQPWPATMDLAVDADVVLFGFQEEDGSGFSIGRGRINGDDIDDLVISATNGDGLFDTDTAAGEVYVVYGRESWPDTMGLEDADVTIYGARPFDVLGVIVWCSDLNQDGFDDILTGAPVGDGPDEEIEDPGYAIVLFGGSEGIGIDAKYPRYGEVLASYPKFEWTPGRKDNVVWVFQIAEAKDGGGVLHTSSYLLEPRYELPDGFFDEIPADMALYWSIYGTTDPAIPPQRLQDSELFSFTRLGIHLLGPDDEAMFARPTSLQWSHGYAENDRWVVEIATDPDFEFVIATSPVLTSTTWEIPIEVWRSIPLNVPVYWRAMGLYQPVEYRVLREWSQETRTFTRIAGTAAMTTSGLIVFVMLVAATAFLGHVRRRDVS